MRYVCSFITALVLGSFCHLEAQSVQGELSSESPRDLGDLTVELQSASGERGEIDRAFVSPDGRFQFGRIAPGSYVLLVKDRRGALIHQQYANTQGFGGFTVRLPAEKQERPVAGLVSVDELRHSPPRAARKAFEQSLKKAAGGDGAHATALLERAVELDPEYLQALNNLGTQYIRAGRHTDAVQCFRRAAHLAPRTPLIHANLAQSLLFVQDYAGAEESARKAISLNAADPVTPRAQLALAMALAGKGELTDARHVMVTCTHSKDEVVRRAAEGFLGRLR